jgi:RNA polymerase sigma-70 factor, ECF subfamily
VLVTAADQLLARTFTGHRAHLVGVAYRLTSSVADAEDAVQESWFRLAGLSQEARDDIRDLRGWLTTVVGRICLDRLRSAAVRRESYVGSWLPEPVVTSLTSTGDDPLDVVVRDDDVRLAALVVLDRLTPEQRVAFVLHDAFSMPFDEIAVTLGCAVPTARQHASRGRKALADADPPPRVAPAEQRAVLEKFLAALATGDVRAVVDLLHPDVVAVGDGGGRVRTAIHEVVGPDKVARFLLGLIAKYRIDPGSAGVVALVNGDLGLVMPERETVPRRVDGLVVRDGLVVGIYDLANPDKLGHVPFGA